MCGLVGVYRMDGSSFSRSTLVSMAGEMIHRGPDGEGYYQKGPISLGHKRLAVLDTTEKGVQPMQSADGKWVIVFNGCIYNYRELRDDLRSRGHQFKSKSDTEVIAEGLSAFGPSVVEHFNGMFAIGAWNTEEQALYLIRDRFGVKPLYFWFSGGTFVFASEIKAILRYPDFKTDLDLNALNEYFTFQNQFTYRTFFKGVEMVPPANTIRIDSKTTTIRHTPWWDFDFSDVDESMTFTEAREETQRLFKQAVRRQIVSDVPVGGYLSGGMDSGSITAVASREFDRFPTFTCGFDMSEVTGREANYDERQDSELMANYFKTDHFEHVTNAGDLRRTLPKVVWHLEEPKLGMSYPNYYISRLASRFVKVCLQGTGGDELFGGYPWRYYRVFGALSQQSFFDQYYSYWQRLVSDKDKKNLFTPFVNQQIDHTEPRSVFERVFTFNNHLKYERPEDHIQNSLYFECKTFLPALLTVGDKLSMAHGLEDRVPFLDNELAAFAQKIPVRYKLANLVMEVKRIDENRLAEKKKYKEYNDGKNILRHAMSDFVPKKILNGKKQGFSAPDESWYRGENADYVQSTLLNGRSAMSDYIDKSYIRNVVQQHMSGEANHRLLIWSLMNVEWWCRIFLEGDHA